MPLDRLQGIDRQKKRLVARRPTNNALRWRSRGTGKSSPVRALLSEFTNDRLRVLAVPAHRLVDLPQLVATLGTREERFIVFSDDLSFEAGDGSYKALKAVLDGSLAAAPPNNSRVTGQHRAG